MAIMRLYTRRLVFFLLMLKTHVSLILTNHATLKATVREDVLEGKKMD